MKTRRFRALNGAKRDYSRIVEKIAIYDDEGNQIDCCTIQKDDEGREYYCPSNPNDKDGLFLDKPKDAIECIKNGFGDAIRHSHLFGLVLENVVKYLDREYGEEIRQKSIEGWKDAKFSYGVKFCYLNSFSNGRLISKDKTLMNLYGVKEGRNNILTFETEDEAARFIEEINKKAEEYYSEYLSLKRTGDKDYDHENVVKPFFNKIKMGNNDSVYWEAFYMLAESKRKKERPEFNMKVVQIVL